MSPSLPADGKIEGLLSRDRPSGSVRGSLEGMREDLRVVMVLLLCSNLPSSSLSSLSLRSKKQICPKVSSLLHTEAGSSGYSRCCKQEMYEMSPSQQENRIRFRMKPAALCCKRTDATLNWPCEVVFFFFKPCKMSTQ